MLVFMGGFPTMISSLLLVQAMLCHRPETQTVLTFECLGEAMYAIHRLDNAKL